MDLSFIFRYKHITSVKKVPSPAPSDSLPYLVSGQLCGYVVLSYWLSEFLFSVFANRFELRYDYAKDGGEELFTKMHCVL